MITLDSVLPLSSSTLRLTRFALGATPDRVVPTGRVRWAHCGRPWAVGSLHATRSSLGSVGANGEVAVQIFDRVRAQCCRAFEVRMVFVDARVEHAPDDTGAAAAVGAG